MEIRTVLSKECFQENVIYFGKSSQQLIISKSLMKRFRNLMSFMKNKSYDKYQYCLQKYRDFHKKSSTSPIIRRIERDIFSNDKKNTSLIISFIIFLCFIFDLRKSFCIQTSVLLTLGLFIQLSISQATSVNLTSTNCLPKINLIRNAMISQSLLSNSNRSLISLQKTDIYFQNTPEKKYELQFISYSNNNKKIGKNILRRKSINSKKKRNVKNNMLVISENVCDSFSREDLTELSYALQNATKALYKNIILIKTNNMNSSCGSVIYNKKREALYLVQQAKLLKQVKSQNSRVYDVLNEKYKATFKMFGSAMKNLSLIYSQEISRLVENLRNDLDEFQQQISYQDKNQNKNLCISHIQEGKYESALKYFKVLKYDTMLKEIIRESDISDNSIQFVNMVEFLRILPTYDLRVLGYETTLKRLNNVNDSLTLILLAQIQTDMKNNDYDMNSQNVKNTYSLLKDKLNDSRDNILLSWADSIRHRSYSKSLIFFEHHSDLTASILNNYMFELVKNVFAKNISNFKLILDFVESLPLTLCFTGFEALMNEINTPKNFESSEIIELAFKIKKVFDTNTNFYNYSQWANLKRKLPDYVNELINGDLCTIKNDKNEFLYVSNNTKQNSTNKRIFSKTFNNQVDNILWKFISIDYNNIFSIKSSLSDEYFYEDKYSYLSISDDPKDVEKYWKLQPIRFEGIIYFKIKSPNGLYITRPENNINENGRIVSITQCLNLKSSCFWQINCSQQK